MTNITWGLQRAADNGNELAGAFLEVYREMPAAEQKEVAQVIQDFQDGVEWFGLMQAVELFVALSGFVRGRKVYRDGQLQ